MGRGVMAVSEVERAEQAWPEFASLLFVLHREDEYQRLIALLDGLIDRAGEVSRTPWRRSWRSSGR